MASVSVKLYTKLEEFSAAALSFLTAREAENQIMVGQFHNPRALSTPLEFAVGVYTADHLSGVATKTVGSQFKLIVSRMGHAEIDSLASYLLERSIALPGVLGHAETAQIYAEVWRQKTGRPFTVEHRQGVYACAKPIIVPLSPGAMRTARADDEDLLVEWRRQFIVDCHHGRETTADSLEQTRQNIKNSALVIWEDQNRPVAMAGQGGQTPHGARVNLVYTPKALRGRGYASSLVSTLTRQLMASGKEYCFLYTDLNNPTSNKIYQRMGYEKISDSLTFLFSA